MRNIIISISVIVALLSGCDELKKEKSMNLFGAMAVKNKTMTMLDISVVINGRYNDFGVLIAGATKTMGGGQFEIGKELKVVWLEDYSSNNPTKGEAFFDSSKLSDIAGKVKEIEFVYQGDKKWKLRAYKALHRYKKDLIREIDSFQNNEDASK